MSKLFKNIERLLKQSGLTVRNIEGISRDFNHLKLEEVLNDIMNIVDIISHNVNDLNLKDSLLVLGHVTDVIAEIMQEDDSCIT